MYLFKLIRISTIYIFDIQIFYLIYSLFYDTDTYIPQCIWILCNIKVSNISLCFSPKLGLQSPLEWDLSWHFKTYCKFISYFINKQFPCCLLVFLSLGIFCQHCNNFKYRETNQHFIHVDYFKFFQDIDRNNITSVFFLIILSFGIANKIRLSNTSHKL